ncbi:hypothetical protein [Streptomyces cinnamoneus]|uniref:Uncharacterized protein n=1 Tax=Streptomyces cinnamoneus TaxID=53446 RepID=A0A918TG83_STRCJ|nr:hypothetical protein [Streptomyces cinnamoneus]GHC45052.1 hypothetical protein GCM10010507_20250 [Streptomyces cinnamoneus]
MYIGSTWATFHQLDASPDFTVSGVPQWMSALLVMGLIVGGGLGTTAAILDGRQESSSWWVVVAGVAAAIAWSLWAADSRGESGVRMFFAAVAPVVSLLALTELMRQLRIVRK